MNELQLADELEAGAQRAEDHATIAVRVTKAAAMLRQLHDEKKALYNLVAEQDKKIIELAFRAVYAERSVEIAQELDK